MKYPKTLMTFLIVSKLLLNGAFAADSSDLVLSPQTQILTNSVKLELPLPDKKERQKYVINVSSDNGYICHNFVREREIKDKLFSLEAQKNIIPELEKKVIQKEPTTSLISTNTAVSTSIGAVTGLILGFIIAKK